MMPSNARSAIFASIRENLAAGAPFDSGRSEHVRRIEPGSTTVGTSVPREQTELLEAFRQSLEMVGAKHVAVENESDAVERLREMISNLPAEKVAISDSELVRRLVDSAGIEIIQDASRDELFSSDVGITSAQWAIAETGTLVLESGAERHRLVSLVPPVHICVLKADVIRQSMAEILELSDPDSNSTITFITGASRTSDIELTLAIGVHGPGELHVIVIKD